MVQKLGNKSETFNTILTVGSTLERTIQNYVDSESQVSTSCENGEVTKIRVVSNATKALTPHLIPEGQNHCFELLVRFLAGSLHLQPHISLRSSSKELYLSSSLSAEHIIRQYVKKNPGVEFKLREQKAVQTINHIPTNLAMYCETPPVGREGHTKKSTVDIYFPSKSLTSLQHGAMQHIVDAYGAFMEHYFDVPQEISDEICIAGEYIDGILENIGLDENKRQFTISLKQIGFDELTSENTYDQIVFPIEHNCTANQPTQVRSELGVVLLEKNLEKRPEYVVERHWYDGISNDRVVRSAIDKYTAHCERHKLRVDTDCIFDAAQELQGSGIYTNGSSLMLKVVRSIHDDTHVDVARSIRDMHSN